MDDRDERIRQRAHRLWEDEGRPEGHEERHWFQAQTMVNIEEGGSGTFRPVDAAEAPIEPQPSAPAFANETRNEASDAGKPSVPHPLEVDPNVVIDGGDDAPVSEIETIRRTLEIPAKRRGGTAPASDREGAMGGLAGTRES